MEGVLWFGDFYGGDRVGVLCAGVVLVVVLYLA